MFVRLGAIWRDETSKEIPAGRVLIIADDAHRFSERPKLLALGCELFESGVCKLLLCARPSGEADINDALARTFDTPNVVRLSPVESLRLEDSENLAEEVLGSECRHLASLATQAAHPLPIMIGQMVEDLELIAKRLSETSGAAGSNTCPLPETSLAAIAATLTAPPG